VKRFNYFNFIIGPVFPEIQVLCLPCPHYRISGNAPPRSALQGEEIDGLQRIE
jgi:hypothetical protein